MQIHELNNFSGTLGSGAYLAVDDGNDTGKVSKTQLFAATEARIDNIIAGDAPSAAEVVDARLGADGVTYPSLGTGIRTQFTDVKSELNEQKKNPLLLSPISSRLSVFGNLWDEDTKAYGYYDTTPTNMGNLITSGTSWYYSPTYIPVSEGDVIVFNNSRPIICSYDINGVVVGCAQSSWAGYTVPSGVAYLRFAVTASSASGMRIFKNGTSQLEYNSKTQLYAKNLHTGKRTITVSPVGSCDYTSLTEALYDTYEEACDVVVHEGTYDIVAEYKALFGNTIFDTMTYTTEGMKNFQWGLFIDQRKVTFNAGAYVVCDMSAYTNDGTRRFSPFNLGKNAIIDGLNCYAINPYYIIHDDFGLDTDGAFKNEIRNCVLISPEPAQGNVIGGGCKKFSTKIVDNCYLDNGNNKPVTMRYHNTNVVAASPKVIIKNTRANARIRLNGYGTQTSTKMTAIVNNCEAYAIEKSLETDSSVDNVDLYSWNNKTTV